MLKGNEYYRRLIERYLANDCSPAEVQELWYFIREDASNRLLLDEMRASFEKTRNESPIEIPADRKLRMQQAIMANVQPVPKVIPLYRKWFVRAAAAVILLSAGLISYLNYNTHKAVNIAAIPAVKDSPHIITPGSDKALLTLADGTVIVLDDAGNGNVAKQGAISIKKENGQVIYDVSGMTSSNPGEIVFNTISTPRGGQYQVILPDGSRVWLNAASSLRFPTAFTGSERNVDLTGEGYFEIAKNAAMPFHVNVNDMQVEVLGTHFNIMAYDNETSAKTTLLEGSVKINAGSSTRILKPGEQARLDHSNGSIKIAVADTEEAVAWKNGYFQFNNEDLKAIMRQFARWYDVEISYEGKEKPRYFSGEVPRTVNLSAALKVLQLSDIRFRMENKKMIVMY